MTNNDRMAAATDRQQNGTPEQMAAGQALKANWDSQVADESMTEDEMAASLTDQASGYQDMAMEEMDEDMAAIMGWQLPLTDSQAEEWTALVNESAREWLAVK